ncbi:hypothetical protein L9F63_010393, partial [Diploptera punctata]
MNPYIRTVFYTSKFLNLIPLNISKNRKKYKLNKISVLKLIISTLFHFICNITYFSSSIYFVSNNMEEIVKRCSAYFLVLALTICHIAVILVCTNHRNTIYDWVFCIQNNVYFPLTRRKDSCNKINLLITVAYLLLFLNNVNAIYFFTYCKYPYLFLILHFTWYVIFISIYMSCLHFITIIQHLKSIIEEINYLFLKMQMKPTALSYLQAMKCELIETKCDYVECRTKIHKIKLLTKYYYILCSSSIEINKIYSPIMVIIAAKMF